MVLNLPANSLRELRAICPVSLTYLFAKQVQQSSEQFVCGGLGVLALLGIGESCTVNVAVLVAWHPFFQFLTGLCHLTNRPTCHIEFSAAP